jgi:glyoxylase-like metal-dependent hydrolase (beta-lactamase superfamily II)
MGDTTPIPTETVDEFAVLLAGYVPPDVPWELGTSGSVGSTVSFLCAGDRKIIVDLGCVPGRQAILDPLSELGYEAEDIPDIVFGHWHPDHTFNAALFPNAQAHDVWGIYLGDQW